MKKTASAIRTIIIGLIFTLTLFTTQARAQVQNCFAAGGGDNLFSTAGPIRGARTMGDNQFYQDASFPLVWDSQLFSTWLYDAHSQVLYGQANRGMCEGAYRSANNQPIGPQSCNQSVGVGHTGPCPNTVYVPDICGEQTGQYPTRAVASPIFYAPLNWGNLTGDFTNAASDACLLDMNFVLTDFASPTKPPFSSGALAYQASVATQPFSGKLDNHTPIAVDTKEGWDFGEVQDTDIIAQELTPAYAVFSPQETIYRGGVYYKVGGVGTVANQDLEINASDAGAPLYVHSISANSGSCWILMGSLLEGRDLAFTAIFQSYNWNIIPALDVAIDGGYGLHQANLQPAGSCTPSGPITAKGNIDPDNFLWYTSTQIDQSYAAQTIFTSWEESTSDTTTGGSGPCVKTPAQGGSGDDILYATGTIQPAGCRTGSAAPDCVAADETNAYNTVFGNLTSCNTPEGFGPQPAYIYTSSSCADGSYNSFTSGLYPPCGGTGSNTTAWADLVHQTNLGAMRDGNGNTLTIPPVMRTVGFTDDGIDPTKPYLSVTVACPSGCTSPNAGQSASDYVTAQINAQANTDGTTVATALAGWGLPSKINVAIETPQPQPKHTQYYAGLVTGLVGNHTIAIALNFNAPPHQISGVLWDQQSSCMVEVAGSPFSVDLNVTTRLFENFSAGLTITRSLTCNTKKYPHTAVGQVITLNGSGTCYGSDKHELCNQQFTLTGSVSGNLMGVPQNYTGGSTGGRFKPGTTIPALPNTQWVLSNGSYVLVMNPGLAMGSLTSTLSPIIGPNQENAMLVANISGIAGPDPGDGFGMITIGQMGGTGTGIGSIAGF